MKKWYLIFVLLGVMLHGSAQLPDLELKNLDGNYVRLKTELGEKLTVIDFWATWCKPCLAAIPKISQLANEFQPDGVTFWGINVDSPRNRAKVKPFIRSMNITYPVFLDTDQELMTELNVQAMPTLLILDAKGKIRLFHEGFRPGDEMSIKEEIKKLLTEMP